MSNKERDPRCVNLEKRILERANNDNLNVYADICDFVDGDGDSGKFVYLSIDEGWADGIQLNWSLYQGKRNNPRLTEEERTPKGIPLSVVLKRIEDYCVARFSGTIDMEKLSIE